MWLSVRPSFFNFSVPDSGDLVEDRLPSGVVGDPSFLSGLRQKRKREIPLTNLV